MPLYEYKCAKCSETFEVIQKFSDEPLKVHPECGGPVERLLSAPTLQFKGSGWYVTDYGRNGSSAAEKPADKAKTETKSESSDSKKSDSAKPASTPAKETSGVTKSD